MTKSMRLLTPVRRTFRAEVGQAALPDAEDAFAADVRTIPITTRASMQNSLFRPEAVAHSTRRLQGEVLLAAPLPAKLMGFFLAAIVLAAALFAGFATYARTASLSGWLIPDRGLIRAASPASGLIQKVLVTEGDVVPQGQRLAQIALAAETEGGNAGEAHAKGLG